MSAKTNKLMLQGMLLLAALLLLAGCGGGDSNPTPDPNGIRPSITALSRTAADIGEQLSILGLNFGDAQTGGSVKLNGVDFAIGNWTDTLIDVTVTAGMTSGIIVVTVGGLDSESGAQAQLFIPAAPAGRPVITAVNPGYGSPGAEFQVAGQGFGAAQGAGNVIFVDKDENETVAEVLVVDVGGTLITQWGVNSIKVKVPSGLEAGTYTIKVSTGTALSNTKQFTVLPVQWPEEAPVITDITPPNGAVGTSITIVGNNFGHNQVDSTLTINGQPLNIVAWSYTVINALIPAGAGTGKIVITVGGRSYTWPPDEGGGFTVANTPVITGLTPSEVRMAHPLTIFGNYFGMTQGTGTVRVGGTVQTVSTWAPTPDPDIQMITIDALKPFTMASETQYDGNGDPILDLWGNPEPFYQVVVTADNGLSSAVEYVKLVTNLKAVVTVTPSAGQRSGAGAGEVGTEFVFNVAVTGGSGSYTYNLIPDKTKPGTIGADKNAATDDIEYTYPANAAEPKTKTYNTLMRIIDDVNGDSITVDGPSVLVVQYGIPVITKIGVADFNRGTVQAPNDWCYRAADNSYHDFTFRNDDVYYTSSLGDIMVGGNPLAHYVRTISNYMIAADMARAQGYRYYHDETAISTNDGAVIAIQGLNFGETLGEVWLKSSSTSKMLVTDYYTAGGIANGWSDTEIQFYIPAGTLDLSGPVQVIPVGSEDPANSLEPLTCSAYVTTVVPNEDVSLNGGVITLLGFDFEPPTVPGKVGTAEYGIWMVRASYTDPWNSSAKTALCLLTTPIPPSSVNSSTIQFNLSDLDLDGNGTVPVEVTNASGDEAAVVEGTLEEGTYYFFLWTGALTSGTFTELAYSGIFSEAQEVGVIKGAAGNQPPVAAFTATPDNGTAPLNVAFNGSGSTDDGTITDYEWDFNGNGTFNEAGPEAAAQGSAGPHNFTYAADGDYLVQLRVTDDGTPALTNTASHNVHVGAVGPGNNLTLRIKVNFNGFTGGDTVESRCWLFRKATMPNPPPGGTDIPIGTFNMPVNDGQFVSHTFTQQDNGDPLIDGTYWIQVTRVKTQWEDGSDLTTMLGPFTLPPDPMASLTGDQYDDITMGP